MELVLRGVSVRYGPVQALRDLSLTVGPGEWVTLLGANGAGKSTAVRAISGQVPYTGEIVWDGENLAGLTPEARVARGLVQVPEGRGIFGNLTVGENLTLAAWQQRDRVQRRRDRDRVYALFPRLAERETQRAETLSGGEQQMLALGRALMSRARLLLLDEPSMGLAPLLVREIFTLLAELNRAGTGMLLVEQNANLALHHATRGYVLETGACILTGTRAELSGHPRVRAAYLGG